MKDIDFDSFKKDILASDLYAAPANTPSEYVEQYDEVLRTLMDKYAPEITKKLVEKKKDLGCLKEKRMRRKYERLWRRTKLMCTSRCI